MSFKNSTILTIFFGLIIFFSPRLQAGPNLSVRGYFKSLPGLTIDTARDETTFEHLLHQRTNLKWYPNMSTTTALELRTRLFTSGMTDDFPGYTEYLDEDDGSVDMSWVLIDADDVILHTMIDRLWLDWYYDKWQIRFGRQRVNWGMNLVWNPNDIFNTYSYFDFDYEERPGTDGLRLQYYTGVASKLELAVKPEEFDQLIAAGKILLNKWDYDWQFFGGVHEEDLTFGGGWAGDIRGGGFRGEVTVFEPTDDGRAGNFLAAVSGDYTFQSSLYLHAEALYNDNGATDPAEMRLLIEPQSVKNPSPAKYSIFAEIAGELTPLLRANLSAILNPSDDSIFLSPAITWSVRENLDLFLIGQLFCGDDGTEFGDMPHLASARVKWSF